MLLKSTRLSICVVGLGLISNACIKPRSNDVKVYAGVNDSQNLASTVKVSIDLGDDTFRTCGGFFMNDSVLVTAATCLDNAKQIEVLSDIEPFKSRPVKSRDFKVHRDYSFETKEQSYDNKQVKVQFVPSDRAWANIAYVTFPRNTAPNHMIGRFATVEPAERDEVWIAGWGSNESDGRGAHVRRIGKNMIQRIASSDDKKIIMVQAARTDGRADAAALGSGDVGVPLYNKDGMIIGLASTAKSDPLESYFSSFFARETTDFIPGLSDMIKVNPSKQSFDKLKQSLNDRPNGAVMLGCTREVLSLTIKDVQNHTFVLNSCNISATCYGRTLGLKSESSSQSTTEGGSFSSSNSSTKSVEMSSDSVCQDAARNIKDELNRLGR